MKQFTGRPNRARFGKVVPACILRSWGEKTPSPERGEGVKAGLGESRALAEMCHAWSRLTQGPLHAMCATYQGRPRLAARSLASIECIVDGIRAPPESLGLENQLNVKRVVSEVGGFDSDYGVAGGSIFLAVGGMMAA